MTRAGVHDVSFALCFSFLFPNAVITNYKPDGWGHGFYIPRDKRICVAKSVGDILTTSIALRDTSQLHMSLSLQD